MVGEKFLQEAAEGGIDFARFGVAAYSLLGEDEFAIDDDFEDAAAGRDKPPRGNVIFEFAFVQNFCRQTDSAFGVVSGRAVGDADVQNGVIHRRFL